MKPYLLQEVNWAHVKENPSEIAVLPWGATEPHNYHLPYGTDTLETSWIVKEAARKAWESGCRVMVLPAIPFGVQNPGQIELPFCMPVRPSTQLILFKDLVKALHEQGIRKVVVANGHGGNEFKSIIRELQMDYRDMFLGLIEWFRMVPNSDYFEEEGDHAGEMETSIMLYCFPELVLPLRKAGKGNAKKFKIEALNRKKAWTPRNWSDVSKDTGIGNPEKATAEKGKKFLEAVTSEITEFLIDLGKHDVADLYEK